MTQRDSSLLRTKPLPALLAACSRLIKWRSTRICLSSGPRLSIVSENAPVNWGKLSTAGRMVSRALIRSVFFAQPGNGMLRRFRARRTRLDMTMRSCGPLRRAFSTGGLRNSSMVMVLLRGHVIHLVRRLLDFVTQAGGLFKILRDHSLVQLLLQMFEPLGQVPALPQSQRSLAHMHGALVHGLEQPLQPLGERRVTLGATQSPGLL